MMVSNKSGNITFEVNKRVRTKEEDMTGVVTYYWHGLFCYVLKFGVTFFKSSINAQFNLLFYLTNNTFLTKNY